MSTTNQVLLDELTFEGEQVEEEEDQTFDDTRRKIFTDKLDPTINDLFHRYKDGDLHLQPDFQRQFVWDSKKSSKLVESILLDIPLPVIYLAEEQDGTEAVIDGQQRLTSFFKYLDGDFKLSGLKVLTELNNKKFKELDKVIQNKIKKSSVRTITFKKESDPELRFEIFERLNTGSVPLNDQELRNCIYRGRYMELLKELAADSDFRYILGIKNAERRMHDVELVLRFAAFHHATYLNYRAPIKKFLNNEMEQYRNISNQEAEELRKAFKNAVSIIKSLLDKNAFKRFYRGESNDDPNGYWGTKQFNASLYDILMYTFAREDKNKVYQNLDSIREALIYLMTEDQEFINSILLATSSVQAVTTRFDKWRITLQDIIGIAQSEPRCFSFNLKEEMYDNDPTCSICNQKIQNIDDSALDHVKQYWKGGKTVPDNARLTHRYCNWARSRND
jgi:uncharacterized protein with ParB-like and HNH nuclease domain